MTRQEAIRRLKIDFKCANCPEDKDCYDSNLRPICEYYADKEKLSLSDALNIAIEALEEKSKTEQWNKTLKTMINKDHIREAINNTHYCEGLMEALCVCTQVPTATIEDTFKTMLEDVRTVLIECLKEGGEE